ncbi:hypothetical protein LCGC14_0584590 [marine sediment metagenome]|uniref:N-acetyltransferase domain-containing protein n=1 Tax=marine sediment metagenome TaxID=412755 RepID=A0A0F9RKE3_9ZZZZ|nr:GNAT family N-acetyltransferase [bacterium]
MKIEKFSIDSYNQVHKLWRKAGISVGSSDSKEELEKMLKRNPNLFLIGKRNDKIIAVVMGGFDGRRGYVHHLAIDSDYQKKGYGRMMMDKIHNIFLQMGVHKVHLFIEKTNTEVVSFYESLGWEKRDDLIIMSYVPNKDLYNMKI